MSEFVTVDEAISKGHRMVNYPSMLIMFGTMGVAGYLGIQEIQPTWISPVMFVISLILPWIYWSFMITKWRLWAFENVRNVHELKKRAILERLIWTDDSIFEKTEIRGSTDKEHWNLLKEKFKKDDIFKDDFTVAEETKIYCSIGANHLGIAFSLAFCLGGIYLIVMTDSYIIGTAFSLLGIYSAYEKFKNATNTEPQIIFNHKGIQTSTTKFYSWTEITNEDIITEQGSEHINCYLFYNHPNGYEKLLIDDYETDSKTLNHLLVVYRGRSRKKNY